MRCFENFKDDRICDMCSLTNHSIYNKCRETCANEAKKRRELCKELQAIESSCPYRMDAYDEYTHYYSCNKDGKGYGRFAEECHVTLECRNAGCEPKERQQNE